MKAAVYFVVILTGSCQQTLNGTIKDSIAVLKNITSTILCKKTVVLESDVTFYLFTRTGQNGTLLNHIDVNLINPSVRSIFIVPGYLGFGLQDWIKQMAGVYLGQEDANIISIDYGKYSKTLYTTSVCAAPQIGVFVATFIYQLWQKNRLTLQATQVMGFSLGAHIAGFAGKKVKSLTGGKRLGKIVGLDAAGAGYLASPPDGRLDKDDAWMVQGLHTSVYQFGIAKPYGSVDFYFHYFPILGCGLVQPGCPLHVGNVAFGSFIEEAFGHVACNHIRVLAYFMESITSKEFLAQKCSSCTEYGLGLCKSNKTMIMGEHCPITAQGVYYLDVNSNTPFAKGS